MNPTLLFISLGLSSLLYFITQYFFLIYRRFDDFNHRSSHKTLATRTGGITLFLSLFILALSHYLLKIELFDYSLLIPLGVLFIIGVYDDLYQADFKLKFIMQIIVAKMIIDQGYVISSLHGLFGIYELPWIIAQLLTIIVFVILVNAYNFIDGIDGLAVTESIKNLLFISVILLPDDRLLPLAWLLIIICLPFYYFNFKKKKKVFLGDAGSLFLGGVNMLFILHILNPQISINGFENKNRMLFALCFVAYPLFDLIRVVYIRLKNGKSPFNADQNHIHHWFVKNGISHFITTLIICGLGALLLSVLFWA